MKAENISLSVIAVAGAILLFCGTVGGNITIFGVDVGALRRWQRGLLAGAGLLLLAVAVVPLVLSLVPRTTNDAAGETSRARPVDGPETTTATTTPATQLTAQPTPSPPTPPQPSITSPHTGYATAATKLRVDAHALTPDTGWSWYFVVQPGNQPASYYFYPAARSSADRYTADVGVGPAGSSGLGTYHVHLVAVDGTGADAIRAEQQSNTVHYNNYGMPLPRNTQTFDTIDIYRTA